MLGRYSVHSLPKALLELSQHPAMARSASRLLPPPPAVPTIARPAATIATPDHIWILAEVGDDGTAGSPPAAGPPAGGDGAPADAAEPAAGEHAPSLLEQRVLAHGRVAAALLRTLMRPPSPEAAGGAAPAAAAAPADGGTWGVGAGAELGSEEERLALALKHLKRMEALLLEPREQTAGAARSEARGAAGTCRRGKAGAPRPQLDGTRRQELLAVAYSNLAALSLRSGMAQPALDFCARAAQIERSLFARVEFTTHLRIAAVLSRLGRSQKALGQCELAWKALLLCARAAAPEADKEAGGGAAGEGSDAADGGAMRTEELPAEYVSAAAVVCCNLAVALVRLHRHAEALEVAEQAERYAARALEPAHEHRRAITACLRYARVFAEYGQMMESAGSPPVAR